MAELTAFPGTSDYLIGGIVAYSNDLKRQLLHVSPVTLELHGAVSSETVIEMVKGLFQVTKADIAIAVSGIFGPTGGTKEKPVGTVWVAYGERGKEIKSHRLPLNEDLSRSEYRERVVTFKIETLCNL